MAGAKAPAVFFGARPSAAKRYSSRSRALDSPNQRWRSRRQRCCLKNRCHAPVEEAEPPADSPPAPGDCRQGSNMLLRAVAATRLAEVKAESFTLPRDTDYLHRR
jgi:hypothetical protein